MIFYKNRFLKLALFFFILQPVFLRCPEEITNDQELVDRYKDGGEKVKLQEEHAGWWEHLQDRVKKFFSSKKEYKSSNDAQKFLNLS